MLSTETGTSIALLCYRLRSTSYFPGLELPEIAGPLRKSDPGRSQQRNSHGQERAANNVRGAQPKTVVAAGSSPWSGRLPSRSHTAGVSCPRAPPRRQRLGSGVQVLADGEQGGLPRGPHGRVLRALSSPLGEKSGRLLFTSRDCPPLRRGSSPESKPPNPGS